MAISNLEDFGQLAEPSEHKRMGKGVCRKIRALITDASAGIDELFARQLPERGLNLVLLARRRERLEALAGELEGTHGIETRVVAGALKVLGRRRTWVAD